MSSSDNISSIAESFFKGTQVIFNFCETEIISRINSNKYQDEKHIVIIGIYYRMYLLYSSADLLNSYKYFQSLAAISRSLFELYLDLNIIIKDNEGEMVEKYNIFPEVEKYRAAKKLVNYFDSITDSNINVDIQRKYLNDVSKRKHIETIIEKYWGRTRKGKLAWPEHWTGKSVSQRASDLGKEYSEFYYEFYPQLSWHIHSGATGYINLSKETFEYMFAVMQSLMQRIILQATTIISYELNINESIDDFDNIIKKLSKLSGTL